MSKTIKKILLVVLIMAFAFAFTGCRREAQVVSYNVSKQADNFNVMRRVTVINTRSDKCILQMTGKISIQDVTNGIAVIVEVDRGKQLYQKHYIYLNDWTMYTVEDISGIGVSKYAYEIEFMPQTLIPVRITADELKQDIVDWAGGKEDE